MFGLVFVSLIRALSFVCVFFLPDAAGTRAFEDLKSLATTLTSAARHRGPCTRWALNPAATLAH